MLLSAYRAAVALFTLGFVVYLCQGLLTGDVDAYFAAIQDNILVAVTVSDLYLSLALACILIAVLERKWWLSIALFIPTAVVGGPLIGIYMLWRLPAFFTAVGIEIAPERGDVGDHDPNNDSERER